MKEDGRKGRSKVSKYRKMKDGRRSVCDRGAKVGCEEKASGGGLKQMKQHG